LHLFWFYFAADGSEQTSFAKSCLVLRIGAIYCGAAGRDFFEGNFYGKLVDWGKLHTGQFDFGIDQEE